MLPPRQHTAILQRSKNNMNKLHPIIRQRDAPAHLRLRRHRHRFARNEFQMQVEFLGSVLLKRHRLGGHSDRMRGSSHRIVPNHNHAPAGFLRRPTGRRRPHPRHKRHTQNEPFHRGFSRNRARPGTTEPHPEVSSLRNAAAARKPRAQQIVKATGASCHREIIGCSTLIFIYEIIAFGVRCGG